jgi:adenylate cyclase
MKADMTFAQKLGRVLERLTRQSGRLPEAQVYGSWLLGRPTEAPTRRRVRIQIILTVFIALINLVGIAVAWLLTVVAVPQPSVFIDAPLWPLVVVVVYVVVALVIGTWWLTRQSVNALRWATEGRKPSATDQRNTFLTPWRVALVHLLLWGIATALTATLYGQFHIVFIPRFVIALGIVGAMVATFSYLATEFTLRPVAAQALDAGPPPRRLAPGIMGRLMTVWMLGSGLPVIGIGLTALFVLVLPNMSRTQFAVAILIFTIATLVSGFVLNWIGAWITATPVRQVRAALERVENGDLSTNLAVFDGTEVGELQRGFNSMVSGLREREKVRDLFGRHVGREVAAAAEAERIQLGGEVHHVAVVFVDIIGSTRLVTQLAAWEVVTLLNRFFGVVVDEVEAHRGLLNKFEGDGCLAIFGAPRELKHPEDAALSAARAISARLLVEVPEVQAGIGVAAGEVVAGNIGAHERFEYTVIGEPVNEAARLCELAKGVPSRLLASSDTIGGATESERAQWVFGDTVTLRGHDVPTRLAIPV